MSSTPKTIQIFLPSGEPHGIRIAEMTTRIVQVIEVPRSLLADFLAMDQSSQVGVYFLLGEATEDGVRLVDVGQTGDLRARLTTHNQKKMNGMPSSRSAWRSASWRRTATAAASPTPQLPWQRNAWRSSRQGTPSSPASASRSLIPSPPPPPPHRRGFRRARGLRGPSRHHAIPAGEPQAVASAVDRARRPPIRRRHPAVAPSP